MVGTCACGGERLPEEHRRRPARSLLPLAFLPERPFLENMRVFRSLLLLIVLGIPSAHLLAWGWNAHRFINRTAVRHLPSTMGPFIADSAAFALRSIDADARRVSGDTSFYAEGPRHYLDIDDYPDFRNLPRNLDTLIARYGWERVKGNGIIPWAIVWTYDSLVSQLRRGDAAAVLQSASDLGHYIADACQPLHATRNYDGQYTGNNGIHSRYESTMLSTPYYLAALMVQPVPASYVPSRLHAAFEEIYRSQALVASVLGADNYAKGVSGWNGSGSAPPAYYHALWDSAEAFTQERVGRASALLGALWYSAWVDAGLLPLAAEEADDAANDTWGVGQSFPNPSNPSATVRFRLPAASAVVVAVHDILGREVLRALASDLSAGAHDVVLDGTGLASGVYYYRIQARPLDGGPPFSAVRSMILLR